MIMILLPSNLFRPFCWWCTSIIFALSCALNPSRIFADNNTEVSSRPQELQNTIMDQHEGRRWVLVSTVQDRTTYVDTQSVAFEDHIRTIAVMHNRPSATDGKRSFLRKYQINCSEKKFVMAEEAAFSKLFLTGELIYRKKVDGGNFFELATKDSASEEYINIGCSLNVTITAPPSLSLVKESALLPQTKKENGKANIVDAEEKKAIIQTDKYNGLDINSNKTEAEDQKTDISTKNKNSKNTKNFLLNKCFFVDQEHTEYGTCNINALKKIPGTYPQGPFSLTFYRENEIETLNFFRDDTRNKSPIHLTEFAVSVKASYEVKGNLVFVRFTNKDGCAYVNTFKQEDALIFEISESISGTCSVILRQQHDIDKKDFPKKLYFVSLSSAETSFSKNLKEDAELKFRHSTETVSQLIKVENIPKKTDYSNNLSISTEIPDSPRRPSKGTTQLMSLEGFDKKNGRIFIQIFSDGQASVILDGNAKFFMHRGDGVFLNGDKKILIDEKNSRVSFDGVTFSDIKIVNTSSEKSKIASGKILYGEKLSFPGVLSEAESESDLQSACVSAANVFSISPDWANKRDQIEAREWAQCLDSASIKDPVYALGRQKWNRKLKPMKIGFIFTFLERCMRDYIVVFTQEPMQERKCGNVTVHH